MPPPGDYAQSCVGRERMFEYFSRAHGTPGRLFRLNYAIDMRYGVLHDVARKVRDGEPIDLTMGHVNVIWQGDANAHGAALPGPLHDADHADQRAPARRRVESAGSPTGFGERFGSRREIIGTRGADRAGSTMPSARSRCSGHRAVPLGTMIDWAADWLARGMAEPRQADALSRCAMAPTERASRSAPIELLRPMMPAALGRCLPRRAGTRAADDWRLMLRLGRGFGVRDAAGRWSRRALALPYGRHARLDQHGAGHASRRAARPRHAAG